MFTFKDACEALRMRADAKGYAEVVSLFFRRVRMKDAANADRLRAGAPRRLTADFRLPCVQSHAAAGDMQRKVSGASAARR